jgi:hypothetical protein
MVLYQNALIFLFLCPLDISFYPNHEQDSPFFCGIPPSYQSLKAWIRINACPRTVRRSSGN